MASLNNIEIFLEFEPVVKLVCKCADCVFNLMNAANIPERREAACNLKQITIGDKGQCLNHLSFNGEKATSQDSSFIELRRVIFMNFIAQNAPIKETDLTPEICVRIIEEVGLGYIIKNKKGIYSLPMEENQ